ncbi:hypothetical protein BKA67DRAFT_652995 [Truncatella angustata]|uniref:Uncharacterized protein n=1 Tax=Truncatella angustata TaxID=152316 RepID=A0A9P9A4D2_9PEZI|nr:uncharacterized protein BKA67DRAFT_652995 [Truncatella angustata]KAH6659779.1 hypothetical protein BKA67DRAFT_652995 [Truncatella angustata]
MVKIPAPPDPRKLLPRNADPEHRGMRKELEKKHGYGYTEPLILGLLGIGLVWNIENQVAKHEERKDEAERKEKEREERRRRRREEQSRSGTWHQGDERNDRSSMNRHDDRERSREYRDESRRGGHRDESRRGDFRDEPRRLDYRDYEYRGYRDQYNDQRNDYRYADRRDGSVRRSNRRDSF